MTMRRASEGTEKVQATVPAIGSRWRLRRDVDRFPHFVAPAASRGTVTDSYDDNVSLRLDVRLPGAEAWGNEIVWAGDQKADFTNDCESLAEIERDPNNRIRDIESVVLAQVVERSRNGDRTTESQVFEKLTENTDNPTPERIAQRLDTARCAISGLVDARLLEVGPDFILVPTVAACRAAELELGL
jgi:hypothetical protein